MACAIIRAGCLMAGIVFLPGVSAEAGAITLAPHRAVYDLVLDRSEKTPDVADITGRIVMEFTGSDCGGYSVTLRFVTEMSNMESGSLVTDARTKTFESGDGTHFRFANETFVDELLAEETHGTATKRGKDLSVELTRPNTRMVRLDPAIVFPTEQVERIITAARDGRKFLQMDVYDGSENGETVYATAVVIGPESSTKGDVGNEPAADQAGVASLRHWPVTVGYFNRNETGDVTPTYVMSFVLYENGVSRGLKIDYNHFAIVGRLSQLEMLPAPPSCPEQRSSVQRRR